MDFNKVRTYLFILLLALVSMMFFYTVKPFLYTIFWAAVLATIFHPFYKYINNRLKNQNLSATITIVLATIIILVPLSTIGTLVVGEAIDGYTSLNNHQGQISEFLTGVNNFLHNNRYVTRFNINDAVISQRLDDFSRNAVTFIYETAKALTQNSLEFIGLFLLMLYTLFFFVRDGEDILNKATYLFPLGDRYEHLLYKKFTSATNSSIKGTILVSAIQGFMGSLLFLLTGVPSPLIWGIIMAVFAIIPVTGTFIVWLPAGLFMLYTGHIWQGIVIIIVGIVLISTIDNLLRPILVGKDLKMHPVIVLFSTLGGILLFGISGFVIGPIVAALFQSFWEIYEDYYHQELKKKIK